MSGAQSTVVDVDKLERDAVFEARERNLEDRVPVEQITDQLLPNSYTEIKTLLWIKSPSTCPVYKEALQEWQRKTKLLTSKVERRTKQSESLKSEIYNLVGYFSVFQGVVLTAVSQAQTSVLNCSKASVPILLSALASAVCFVGIWQKQQLIHSLEKTIECDTLALQVGNLASTNEFNSVLRCVVRNCGALFTIS